VTTKEYQWQTLTHGESTYVYCNNNTNNNNNNIYNPQTTPFCGLKATIVKPSYKSSLLLFPSLSLSLSDGCLFTRRVLSRIISRCGRPSVSFNRATILGHFCSVPRPVDVERGSETGTVWRHLSVQDYTNYASNLVVFNHYCLLTHTCVADVDVSRQMVDYFSTVVDWRMRSENRINRTSSTNRTSRTINRNIPINGLM